MKWEIVRKSIHFSGLSVPIFYYFTNKIVTIAFLGFFLVLSLIFDYYRIKYLQKIPIVGFFMKKMTRRREKNSIGAHVYFIVGCLIVVFFFEKNVAIASILMLIFGDGIAAITGKSFGKTKIYGDKTLIGSISCFFCCVIIGYVALGFPAALPGALAATIAELQDTINDNLAIPVFTGTVIHFLSFSGVLL